MASSSSLSNVVSTLVRAQMGSSVPSSVTDEDLDRHIGEIILREAKAKAERYKSEGVKAYLPRTDPNAPKPNKRFLSSIIKNTDEHNKGIQKIHDQIRQEREEQDRRERMKRAKEAAAVRRSSESRSSRRHHYNRDGDLEDRWRPEDDDERDRERKRRKRNWEKDFGKEEEKEKMRRGRSRSVERKRYWDEDEDEYEERIRKYKQSKGKEKSSKGKQRRLNSPSPVPSDFDSRTPRSSPHSHSRSPSPKRRASGRSKGHIGRNDEESTFSKKEQLARSRESSPSVSSSRPSTRKRRKRFPSPSPSNVDTPERGKDIHEHQQRSPPPSLSSGQASNVDLRRSNADQRKSNIRPPSPSIEPPSLPLSPPPPSSKMDKYFEPDYDPRFDVTPLTNNGRLTVNVPATGLIDDPSWDSWEAMLELIKIKREDKIEKKRLEKMGLLPDSQKSVGGSGKKGKGMVSASVTGEDRGLMDITYTKRGTVREWDMGKDI